MAFNIPPIEEFDFYTDYALRTARKDLASKEFKGYKKSKAKNFEIERLKLINILLRRKLNDITKSFPNFDNLTEFYEEMVRTTLDYDELKASLGSLNWAGDKVNELSREYKNKIIKKEEPDEIKELMKQYIGRVISVFKQIRKNLKYLEKSRHVMENFPSIKEGHFTIAIVGFPNVGKSTLLSKLTTSKPEIQSYAFTTKNLNVGYMSKGYKKIQFIDTPGTLNRLDKMNNIEKIAYLAIKYCANLIIYVYDLTELYPVEDQHELLKRLKKFDKEILVFLSKTDILDKKVVKEFLAKNKCIITDIEEVKQKVLEKI